MNKKRSLMLGNEAMARGLIENGCTVAASYPGTPASEILSSVAAIQKKENLPMHVQWAINEKVAFEIAYAASMAGLRAAVSMKQVGLNVASDPLMSAAYLGTKGGFIVISADDPGPHSSQTEQDSRLTAMAAKIPVFDPESPSHAKEMMATAYELSEAFEIPVLIRPTTRICHSRQDVDLNEIKKLDRKPEFEKNPGRWAATPKFRLQLHKELETKLKKIAQNESTAPRRLNQGVESKQAVVVSGVAAAHTREIINDLGLWDTLPVYHVIQPFPLHIEFVSHLIQTYDSILILEESVHVIEMQIADRKRIKGKQAGFVPSTGELSPEIISDIICTFAGVEYSSKQMPSVPGRRPTLCAGCPHRASFFAIKKAARKGIYTSDIGCYTLGLNLGAVDTVLCMGATISQAAGFHHAYKNEEKPPPLVSTIGDSTFFHSGVAPLIDAVVQKVPFVLVILDNRTTAMTGNQPTPATGFGACGEPLDTVNIKALVKGCGVKFCKEMDPYDLKGFTGLLKEALSYCKENGPAVVLAKHPCLIDHARKGGQVQNTPVTITDECDGCAYCVDHFECPALVLDNENERVNVDMSLCTGCKVCVDVCPKKNIEAV